MRLRYKIFVIVAAALLSLVAVFYVISREKIQADFLKLEAKNSFDNLERTRNALQTIIDGLHTKSSDWAVWDDNYQFVQNHNPDFIESNLTDQSIVNLKLNGMAFLDLNGSVVYKKFLDLRSSKETHFPEEIIQFITQQHLFFGENDLQKNFSGIILIEDKSLMVSIRPILKSDNTGPVRGTLIFCQYLSSDLIKRLSETAYLRLDIQIFETLPVLLKSKLALENSFIDPITSEVIMGYTLLQDILKKPSLVISVSIPRNIYKQGLGTIRYLLFALIVAGVVFILVILIVFEKYIVHRLATLSEEVGAIERERRFSGRVRVTGKDELSDLSHSINQMLKTLDATIHEGQTLNKNLQATQNQLLQSQKMESIGKLAAGISHDFNNLLGVIIGYAALLLDEFKDNPKVFKKLGAIQKSAERGTMVTRELLGFARKGKYEKINFNLNDIIKEVTTILAVSIDKKITLKTDFEKDLWAIEGDKTQILQVLMNLVINSRDAMPGSGEIIIKSENSELKNAPHIDLKPGPYVHLTVADTGTGMSEELLRKIFDPFFTTKSIDKGTGLGLSMVYGIMKNHEGAVVVDSQLGCGTKMHLYFPKSTASIEISQKSDSVEPIERKMISIPVVLIAEDEEFLRDFYLDYFSKYFPSTKILFASNGEEAVEIFRSHREELNLLLLDAVMPKLDGIRAFREMKKIDSSVRVIFISGYAESDSIAKLRQEGNVGFIQKPLESSKFLAEIEKLLK